MTLSLLRQQANRQKAIVTYPLFIRLVPDDDKGHDCELMMPLFDTLSERRAFFLLDPEKEINAFPDNIEAVLYQKYESWMINLRTDTNWIDFIGLLEEGEYIESLFHWFDTVYQRVPWLAEDRYTLEPYDQNHFLILFGN